MILRRLRRARECTRVAFAHALKPCARAGARGCVHDERDGRDDAGDVEPPENDAVEAGLAGLAGVLVAQHVGVDQQPPRRRELRPPSPTGAHAPQGLSAVSARRLPRGGTAAPGGPTGTRRACCAARGSSQTAASRMYSRARCPLCCHSCCGCAIRAATAGGPRRPRFRARGRTWRADSEPAVAGRPGGRSSRRRFSGVRALCSLGLRWRLRGRATVGAASASVSRRHDTPSPPPGHTQRWRTRGGALARGRPPQRAVLEDRTCSGGRRQAATRQAARGTRQAAGGRRQQCGARPWTILL